MIGPFLNALGILLGALYGLVARAPVSVPTQKFFKASLGVFTVFLGLRLIYENVQGTLGAGVKQLLIAALAVIIGFWIGKLLCLQRLSNRMGRYAGKLIDAAQKNPHGRPVDGFIASTILFCAAPLGLLGLVTDATTGFFFLLGLKAVMDGMAMTSFVKIFRWPAALSALAVFLFLYGLALAIHGGIFPWLDAHALVHPVNTTAGLLACVVAIVIFEVRRVELANYLPALVVAPLLAWWLA